MVPRNSPHFSQRSIAWYQCVSFCFFFLVPETPPWEEGGGGNPPKPSAHRSRRSTTRKDRCSSPNVSQCRDEPTRARFSKVRPTSFPHPSIHPSTTKIKHSGCEVRAVVIFITKQAKVNRRDHHKQKKTKNKKSRPLSASTHPNGPPDQGQNSSKRS